MKKKEVIKVLSIDGEIHFVLQDHLDDDEPAECISLGDPEIITAMKREAAKPLLILRAE